MNAKAVNVCALLLSLIAAGSVLAEGVEGTGQQNAMSPVVLAAADLKWIDLDPTGAPGVKVADLWGDHRTGPFGAIFRLAGGILGFATYAHTRYEACDCVGYVRSGTGREAGVFDLGRVRT